MAPADRMRVLHIIPALFGGDDGVIGGAERYVLELARHMAERTPTTLLSFGERDRTDRVGELTIHVIGNPWFVRGSRFNPLSGRMLGHLLRADVVHCHQQHVLTSSLAASVSRLSGRKVVVTDLGGGAWDISAYLSTDSWYHHHLHISDFSRRNSGHLGRSDAHVIYGGVDAEKFHPAPETPSGSVGRAVFVGRLLPHKGIDYLIQGLPPGMELDIVGDVHDSEYYARLHDLATGRHVRFLHGLDDRELIDAYRAGAIVVLPSVYQTSTGERTGVPELLGQTLLEGMACGLAALCTSVASLPEVVEDGATGFVVPPNDPEALGRQLAWYRDHPDDTASMGRAGRERVLKNFTWAAVVDRCLEIYAR